MGTLPDVETPAIQELQRETISITVDLVNLIQTKGAALHKLNNQIDTSTPTGKFTFHIFAARAEFERDLVRERINAGLASARARGRVGGRPKGLSRKSQHTVIIVEKLYMERQLSVKDICEQLSISKATLYKYLAHQGVKLNSKTGSD